MARQWPARFAGLATLPVQDVKSAIDELERAVTMLGLKGAELDTNVNGEQWDEPKFLPLFKAAEAMGAVLFFHPQPQNNFLMRAHPPPRALQQPRRDPRRRDRRRDPDLRRRAGGVPGSQASASPTAAAPPATRWGGSTAAGRAAPKRASASRNRRARYQRRLYYDTVTGSEEALRFLLDQVGADRVVLGSDWPFVPWHPSPGGWVQGLKSPDPGGEGEDPLAEPGVVAEAVTGALACGTVTGLCRAYRLHRFAYIEPGMPSPMRSPAIGSSSSDMATSAGESALNLRDAGIHF